MSSKVYWSVCGHRPKREPYLMRSDRKITGARHTWSAADRAFCVSGDRTPHESSGPQVGPLGVKPHTVRRESHRASRERCGTGCRCKSGDEVVDNFACTSRLSGLTPLQFTDSVGRGGFWLTFTSVDNLEKP